MFYRFENYIPNSLPIKGEASNLVNYLIFSNCASFIWFSRLYNGQLIVDEDEINFNEMKQVCIALVKQLLNKDSQDKLKISQTNSDDLV